jgi:hypothetical protein
LLATTQGRPSRSRANLGLNDAIPLELNDGSLQRIEARVNFYSTEISEKPEFLKRNPKPEIRTDPSKNLRER